jgi:hypothetical protein
MSGTGASTITYLMRINQYLIHEKVGAFAQEIEPPLPQLMANMMRFRGPHTTVL